MSVKKIIIPAAGVGSRFFPITKTIPKEMLPLLNKPAVQYVAEEAVRSGVKNIIFVLNSLKKSIEDHFDTLTPFQSFSFQEKKHSLEGLEKLIDVSSFSYIRQHSPQGLGDAVLRAKSFANDAPYIGIALPDDIIDSSTPALAQLIAVSQQEKCSVVAVQEVPLSEVSSYGVIRIKKQVSPTLFQVKEIIEKPTSSQAPSNLAVVGRYVLSTDIFGALEQTQIGLSGELHLTDAIQHLIYSGEKVFACKVQGTRYDLGTPLGWIKANIASALKHPQLGESMLSYLSELEKEMIFTEGQARRRPRSSSL